MRSVSRSCLAAALIYVAIGFVPAVSAQGRGDFTNFELPRVDPITTATVQGNDYVLVCNTEDHSVEIFDADDSLKSVARVPVGLGPVTVRWNPKWQRFYTCNMLGDSISVVHLTVDDDDLIFDVERTVPVEDEPMDIAPLIGNDFVFVTSNTGSTISLRWAITMEVVAPGFEQIFLVDNFASPKRALKEPRRVFMVGLKLFVLGHRGSRVGGADGLDLWSFDFATGQIQFEDNLGSTHFAIEPSQDGRLWIASGQGEAALRGEAAVKAAPTGFVRSLLHRIDKPGTSQSSIKTRDLHLDYSSSGAPSVAKKWRSLAHPHAIEFVHANGRVNKIYLAAYNSDRIGVVTNATNDDVKKWQIRTITMPRKSGSRSSMAGPRGMVMLQRDGRNRLFVLNALDSSLVEIDARRDRVVRVRALRNDPVPQYIKDGRKFLYDARLSGNGFVSCASCHVDGRIDGLPWDLGSNVKTDKFDPELVDGNVETFIKGIVKDGYFPPNKGFLMTQTLQGLAKFEANKDAQRLFSAEPFHWRGDRSNLTKFAGAFESLLGGKKLTAAESEDMEEFMLSIHHPPNPRQPKSRVPSGSLGDANDPTKGTGAKRGMKLFHIEALASCAQRSCVHCHSLPTGSNSRNTEGILLTGPLRNPIGRERVLEFQDNMAFPSAIRTAEFGVAHNASIDSTNAFNRFFFSEFPTDPQRAVDINKFNLEFDNGVAPMVGLSMSVHRATKNLAVVSTWLKRFEDQVLEANVDLAVQAKVGSRRSGYFFDASVSPARYATIDGSRRYTRSQLLSFLRRDSDALHFICTTLGEGRRVADPSGKPRAMRGSRPSNIRLQSMRPNTFHMDVTKFTKNWKPKSLGGDFDWTAKFSDNTPVPEPTFPKSIRLMQWV